jgi:hypothetical protein
MPDGLYTRNEEAAARASALLFRIGFAILVIVMPMAASGSRRAVVVLAPVGAGILFFASLLMPGGSNPLTRAGQALMSPIALAALFLLGWSVLSLAWTPFPGAGAERLARTAGLAILAIGAILALPERMRASNLYLMALGTGAAGLLWFSVWLAGGPDVDPVALERARIMIILLAWPSVAWLALKRRAVSAMAAAAVAGGLAFASEGQILLLALMAGGIVLGGAIANAGGTTRGLAAAMAAIVLLGPLIALAAHALPAATGGTIREWQIWGELIMADPSRLVTGHGVETALRNRIVSVLDAQAPRSLVFELWYEFGVLGALAASVLLAAAAGAIGRLGAPLLYFALGCMAFAFTLAVAGLGRQQTWWLTALAATLIAFAGIANGMQRTSRPQAKARFRL